MLKTIMSCALVLLLSACSYTDKTEIKTVLSIHINQVAFELDAPKSAIITSNQPLDLAKEFSVVSVTSANIKKGVEVFKAKLTQLPKFNQWRSANINEKELNYYQADFSDLVDAGKYKLVLTHAGGYEFSSEFTLAKQVLFKKTVSAMLQYFNGSRNDEDYNWAEDKHIRIFDSQRYADVSGGWNDAGGDTGKYLSHLSYANYFNPQQLAQVGWALAYSYQAVPALYKELNLTKKVLSEVFWGADYLHRILDQDGYFYMTVFDQWNTNNAERVVTAYVGADGIYSEYYQSAFREGAGSAIAALAKAAVLAKSTGKQGEFTGRQYLADAIKAFHHLQDNKAENNKRYADDGQENIIDDYTALLAATELFKATQEHYFLEAARLRANNLANRLTDEGWFISNALNSDNLRPFYHAGEAGFPIVSLSHYLTIETQDNAINQAKQVISKHLDYQLALNNKVSNPFNYARQPFKIFKNGDLSNELQEGFFIPHANETNYWWQGESARLSSLAMAAILGGRITNNSENHHAQGNFGVSPALANFAQNQLDWTLGRNPYNLSMLNGFGINNPKPYVGLSMVYGGISNGITGGKGSDSGRGIEFGPESDWQNWRWVEQWLPHSTWFLLATTEMARTKE